MMTALADEIANMEGARQREIVGSTQEQWAQAVAAVEQLAPHAAGAPTGAAPKQGARARAASRPPMRQGTGDCCSTRGRSRRGRRMPPPTQMPAPRPFPPTPQLLLEHLKLLCCSLRCLQAWLKLSADGISTRRASPGQVGYRATGLGCLGGRPRGSGRRWLSSRGCRWLRPRARWAPTPPPPTRRLPPHTAAVRAPEAAGRAGAAARAAAGAWRRRCAGGRSGGAV